MSFIRKILTALLCVLLIGGVRADTTTDKNSQGEFADYFEGAMVIYAEKIDPSIDMSEKFYAHVLKTYIQSKCQDAKQCHAMGVIVANQFARSVDSENNKYEVQRNTPEQK